MTSYANPSGTGGISSRGILCICKMSDHWRVMPARDLVHVVAAIPRTYLPGPYVPSVPLLAAEQLSNQGKILRPMYATHGSAHYNLGNGRPETPT